MRRKQIVLLGGVIMLVWAGGAIIALSGASRQSNGENLHRKSEEHIADGEEIYRSEDIKNPRKVGEEQLGVVLPEKKGATSALHSGLYQKKVGTNTKVQWNDGRGYEISSRTYSFDKDNFLEYAAVDYPIVSFFDGTADKGLEEKVNGLLYETALLHYDQELEQEVNAFYSCHYYIAHANEKYISIYFEEEISAGMSRVNIYEDAVTISIETGEKVSLEEFGDIDEILDRVESYEGEIYTDGFFTKEDWDEKKKDFIAKWKEREDAVYHGYYFFDGRIGFLFDYYRTGRERAVFEFSGIVELE